VLIKGVKDRSEKVLELPPKLLDCGLLDGWSREPCENAINIPTHES